MRLPIVMLCSLFFPSLVFGDHHFSDPVIGHIPITPVTQAELDSIEHGDCQASSRVMARLDIVLQEKGIESVRLAVPAIHAHLSSIMDKGRRTSECEAEHALGLADFLGRIGDPGSRSILLRAIRNDIGAAHIGLAKMDSAVDSVITYLQHDQLRTRGTAGHTLVRMYRSKPSLFSESQIKLIRRMLLENMERYVYKGTYCFALATFGDSTAIPVLSQIATKDTLTGLGGRYPNRRMAQYAIDQIRAR